MANTVEEIREKQKTTFWVIMGIAAAIVALIIMLLFIGNRNRSTTSEASKRLLEQNEQLIKNNVSLLETVDQLSITVLEDHRQDSILMDLTDKTARLLPGINQNISNLKNQYEKGNPAYRNYDVADVQQYIATEARRIRAEQAGRPQTPD